MKKPLEIKFPADLIQSLDNAETLCKEELSGDKFVKVQIKKKELLIQGRGDVGWYKETFQLKKDYGKVEFEINSKSFREILVHLKKAFISDTKMKFVGDNFEHVVILKGV